MPKRQLSLFKSFQPQKYELEIHAPLCLLTITGQKSGPPSKRISLHQKKIKLISARITRIDKHPAEFNIARINYLPKIQQVRFHTKEILYPGRYQIVLEYQASTVVLEELKSTEQIIPSRQNLPCIDEPEAWHDIVLEIKR